MALTHPISIQLYSGRKFPPVEAQLATVVRHGYTNVETFGPFHDNAVATRRLLDSHGLSVRSAHLPLQMLESEPGRALDISLTLGIAIAVAPYLAPPDRPTSLAGWRELGTRLAKIGERFAANGLRFAWHNHDFEFHPLPDGSLPIEHVLGESLLWEADLAWVTRGGAEPAKWLAHYSGRIPLVHVKDIAPAGENADEDGWADVGAGVLPWSELWAQCVAAGAEIMVAEHDNPSDFDRFAGNSAEAMRGFAGGDAR